MNTDPLRTLVEGHERVSEWLTTMWEAPGLLEDHSPAHLIRLQAFLRDHVMDHFELEETVIFPALLELDARPAVASLVAELRRDHVRILGACSRLFAGQAWALAGPDSGQTLRALRSNARQLIETLLAHAAREDAHLLPYVSEHRAAIALRMPAEKARCA
jgi:iron-sulfur cluster repair protein YtfE (RIC family)